MGRHPRLLLLSGQVSEQVGQSFYGDKEGDNFTC